MLVVVAGSLQEVAGEEEEEAEQEGAVDEQPLLAGGERIAAEPELLVLRKSRNLDALALEEGLRGAARGAQPVVRELRERQPRRHRVRRVPHGLVVPVPARPALVDPRVQHRKLLEPPRVQLRPVLLLRRRGDLFLFALRRRRLEWLVVLGNVDGMEREEGRGQRCGQGPLCCGQELQGRRWWRPWVLGHHGRVD
jgi:hypothetical protein